MRIIHIARDRRQLGKFTPEQVAEGLQDGQFLPTDLAWEDPMQEWKPLAEFQNLPPAPVDDFAISESASETETFQAPPPVVPEPAWENHPPAKLWPSMVTSVTQVLSTPAKTFANMPTTGGFLKPLKFYVIVGTLTSWVSMAYQLALTLVNPTLTMGENADKIPQGTFVAVFGFIFLIMPVLCAIGAFVSSGLFHLPVLVLGGSDKNFETTFRVVCYAGAAASVFQLVPVCGSYILMIYTLVLMVIGLREAHKITTITAVFAVLVPVLFCCGALVALGFGAGALAAGAAPTAP